MRELNKHFEKSPKDVPRSSFEGRLEIVFTPQHLIRHCKSFPSGPLEAENSKRYQGH